MIPGGRQFDRYLVVDWSAKAVRATGADSIWIADLAADGALTLSNPATRRLALEQLVNTIDDSGDQRLLVGFDASLGYPAGTAALFGLPGIPWQSTWRTIAGLSTDDDRNRNNRFEVAAVLNHRAGGRSGPFWGCPPSRSGPHLAPTKPSGFGVAEFRHTEVQLRAQGWYPSSCWQLLGAGSVGGQTLTLLPMLSEFGERLGDRFAVWPFTTGLNVPRTGPGEVVCAEVWPTMFSEPAGPDRTLVKDAVQVRSTVAALHAADRSGELTGWFRPNVDADDVVDVVAEEGWVLGGAGGPRLR